MTEPAHPFVIMGVIGVTFSGQDINPSMGKRGSESRTNEGEISELGVFPPQTQNDAIQVRFEGPPVTCRAEKDTSPLLLEKLGDELCE